MSVLLWSTLALMAVPSATMGTAVYGPTATLHPPVLTTPPAYVSPVAPSAPTTPSLTQRGTLSGSDPRQGVPFDAATVLSQEQRDFETRGINPVGWMPGAQPPAPLPTVAAQLKASAASSPAPAKPLPLASNIVTGTVYGFVYLQGTSTPVSGASVTAYSNSGAICPQVNCTTILTTANGSFGWSAKLEAPLGNDYIEVDYSRNESNYSYLTVLPNSQNFVGIVYITPDALGFGYVLSNVSSPKGISGVQIYGTSRDQLIQAQPPSASTSNGSFYVSFPPEPSIIRFNPTYRYESDFRFANGTPHYAGQPIVDFGKVYLTPFTYVKAELYDAAKSTPTSPVTVSSAGDYAMTVCIQTTGNCQTQGQTNQGGNVVTAMGVPGPSKVKIYGTGYLYDEVTIGNLSKVDVGKVVDIGKVFLTPLGGFSFKVSITTNSTGYSHMWPTSGFWYANVCSMQGYQSGVTIPSALFGPPNMTTTQCELGGCVPVKSTPLPLAAYPGINDIKMVPDTTPTCNPFAPTWPIPNFFPVWGNETWANGTPDYLTNLGWLNMTPGTYLYGHVYTQGHTYAPRNWTVTAVSDYAANILSPYSFSWAYVYQNFGGWKEESSGWSCTGAQMNNESFCVPAPPGDFTIQVTSPDNYPTNFTWGFSHNICCEGASELSGLPLSAATLDQEQSINLTPQGRVTGHVFRLGTNLGVSFGTVQVCSAGGRVIPGIGCGDAIILPNGSFSSWAPLGYDYISTSAADFESNTVWAYVTGNSSTPVNVGNITLVPRATIDGFVVDPQGSPIFAATVKSCLLQTTTACTPLGLGQTNSAGYYNGTVAGGWLPWSTYAVQATAPGYNVDWTFVNASTGLTTTAPTLTLVPVGYTPPSAPHPAASKTSNLLWVFGTVIDNDTGYGVRDASVQACPQTSFGCYTFNFTTNSLGQFNETIPTGSYNLQVNAPGYVPYSQLFTISGAGSYNVGIQRLDPYGWVTGHADFYPWSTDGSGNITVPKGFESKTFNHIPLGPVANVQVCSKDLTVCAPSGPVSSSGNFTVQSPQGLYLVANMVLSGTTTGPETAPGSTGNNSIFNSSGWLTVLPVTLSALEFSAISGYVRDGSAVNPTDGAKGWLPVAFAPVSVTTTGPLHSSVTYTANGGGWIEFFVQSGPNQSQFSVTTSSMYSVGGIVYNGTLVAGGNYSMGNITVHHFGFVTLHVFDSVTNLPASYVGLNALYIDFKNTTAYQVGSNINGGGYANVTSMFGKPVRITIGGSQDFNNTSFVTQVNESATTIPSSTSIPGEPGMIALDHWGWARSVNVNNSSGEGLITIVDFAKQLPLPGVNIIVSSSDPAYGSGTSQSSNWFGQFLADAPVGPHDTLAATRYGYLANNTLLAVKPGSEFQFRSLNLTGDGVVAGKVVGLPSGIPISQAAVQLCAPKGVCYTASTNSSGIFWILAPPGADTVTVTADGYVSNSSAPALGTSDQWTWMGTVELSQFAFASGTVRELPSGFPVNTANVSLCSPLGNPTGPCGFSNLTAPDGSFVVQAPAGTYVLSASAPNHNTSYRPMALKPGQHAQVGTIFLQSFGQLRGFVDSAATLTAVAGASVYACAKWGGGSCTAPVTTDNVGSYALSGPPGPYLLTVSAPGYADGYQVATIVSGALTSVLPVLLTPLGVDQSFPVSGSVVNASNPAQGLAGAIVSLSIGNALSFSTAANSQGSFSFQVVWGSYTLTASSPGYRPASRPLVVNGPITSLNLALTPMTYNVSGVVTDGLNQQPLAGVSLMEDGLYLLGVTQADGTYLVALTNGTHFVTASYGGPLSIAYSDVAFSITVNGANQVHSLALFPATVTVTGTVVDSLTGLALPNAGVVVSGLAADGVPITRVLTADGGGAFSVLLPMGSYNASTSYSGYVAKVVTFSAEPPASPLTLALVPMGVASSVPSSTALLLPFVAALVGVIVAAALVALFVFGSRKRKRASAAAAARRSAPRSRGGT